MSKYWMDTYCAATLEAAPGHKCLCTHHRPLHPSPHRCACGHLWGDPFVEMTYDEQRAFLGLKDIRGELAMQRLNTAMGEIVEAFRPVAEAWGRVATQLTEYHKRFYIAGEHDPDPHGLAGEKQ